MKLRADLQHVCRDGSCFGTYLLMDVIRRVTRPVVQSQHPGHSWHMFGVAARKSYLSG